jgi:MFS family permease
MRAARELLRKERRGRLFLAAYTQSSLGNGAGYVALVVLAYDRRPSAWAIALVLMADFLPAMVVGPLLGAAVDRWSRRWCAVASDLVRAVAFIGIAFVGSIGATVALALLAGVGAALFTPAALAAIPSLVEEENLPAATSLFGGITDLGRTVGPALAGLGMVVAGADAVVIVNGVTFLVSAALLARLDWGRRPQADDDERPVGLLREAREGLVAGARMPGIQVMLLASSGVLLFAGMLNVAELLLARKLGTGEVGYSALVAAYGGGFVAGSLYGARGGELSDLKRRYLGGILIMGLGLVLSGVAPLFGFALAAFAVTGFGNGMMLVHERLIFQRVVPDRLMGRLFALADTAGSWAFALAFVAAGALLSVAGTRTLFLVAGAGGILIWAVSAYGLRSLWTHPPRGDAPEPQGSEAAA